MIIKLTKNQKLKPMNNLLSYELYFKQIYEKHNKLNGFYHIDLFEFDTFLKDLRGGKFKTPLLILESYNTGTLVNGQYNVHDVLQGALVVLGKFDIKTIKPESKTTFLAELEDIIKQVKNKMLLDKRIPCSDMIGLIPESITISRTETIANNFQGYRMEFTINLINEPKLNPNHWI